MLNILITIKNHILKILGPFGFQESGSLSFDHIIDFHDYITVYLIFIFVLVSWALLYSANIVRFPKFVMFFVGIWYGIYLFIKTISVSLIFLYSKTNLTNTSLYRTVITFENFVHNFYTTLMDNVELSNHEGDDTFEKLILVSKFVAIYNVILTSIATLNRIIGVFFFCLRELFLLSFKENIDIFFNRLSALRLKELNPVTTLKQNILPFFGFNQYSISRVTKDVWSLYALNLNSVAFKRIIRQFCIRVIFLGQYNSFVQLVKTNLYYILNVLIKKNLIVAHIITFFNDGSDKLNDKTLSGFYTNVRTFTQSTNNIVRFARRITHASTLEIIWTIFPSFILLMIAVPSLILLYELDAVAPVSLGVKIIGRQWYWSYSIGSSFPIFKDLITLNLPEFSNWDSYMVADETSHLRLLEVDNPLFLPAGIPITLFITASDVIHSWAVPALGIKVDAIPGRLNQVSFTIYDTGIFYGQCSELCGVNHGFMPIQIISLVDNSHLIH